MNNVAVACWSISSVPGQPGATQIDDIPALSRHISFDTVMASAVNAMPNHPIKIFVAPEYLFAERDSDPNANQPMIPASRSQKHNIYGRLRLISSRYPNIYIVAGTIAYEKRALGGIGAKHSYNVCPVLYGGEIIKTIYKSDDDGMLQSEGTFGAKGDPDAISPIFAAGGISIGIDICLDYLGAGENKNGRLARFLASHNTAARPDIHIQISGTNGAFPSKTQARTDGAYIHCDLVRDAEAFQVVDQAGDNATTSRLVGTAINQSVGNLRIFSVTLG